MDKVCVINIITNHTLLEISNITESNGIIRGNIVKNNLGPRWKKEILNIMIGVRLEDHRSRCRILKYTDDTNTIEIEIDNAQKEFNRLYERFDIKDKFRVKVKPKLDPIVIMDGENISFGGIRLKSKNRYELGTEVIVELNTQMNQFYFDGKIVYVKDNEDGKTTSYGIQFLEENLRSTHRDALYSYILGWAHKKKDPTQYKYVSFYT